MSSCSGRDDGLNDVFCCLDDRDGSREEKTGERRRRWNRGNNDEGVRSWEPGVITECYVMKLSNLGIQMDASQYEQKTQTNKQLEYAFR
jgi:hypothetical protein